MRHPILAIVAALDEKIAATTETVVMEIPCPDGWQGCLVLHQRPIPNPDYTALVVARTAVLETMVCYEPECDGEHNINKRGVCKVCGKFFEDEGEDPDDVMDRRREHEWDKDES